MFKVTKAGNFINIAVAGYNETTEIKYNVLENETYKVTANDTVTVTNDTNETVNVTDNEHMNLKNLRILMRLKMLLRIPMKILQIQ